MASAFIKKRDVYRLRNGRFAKKRDLWQGPPKPQHIVDREEREFWERARQKMIASICAPNLLLESLSARGRVMAV